MTRLRLLSLAVIGAGLGFSGLSQPILGTGSAWAAGDAVRPAIGNPLQAAQKLITAKKFKEALAEIHKADVVPDKTPHETVLIEEMRGSAAQGAGDTPAAIKAFETVIASGALTGADQQKMIYATAGLYYSNKDYAKTISMLQRYTKEGGNDPGARTLLEDTYYASGDYASTAKEYAADVQALEKAGKAPTEKQLTVLETCYLKLNDKAAVAAVTEKLVTYYPKPDYWNALLHNILTKPGFSDRLSTDVGRLRLATGTLVKPEEYTEQTQLALQDGVPGEAKAVMDKGTAAKVLGTGTGIEADREKRLLALVTKTIDDDQKALPKNQTDAAAAKDGNALVNVGFDLVGYGQFDKGIPLMEQGFQKGGLKHPEEAKLHIGYAYLQAGKKDKAIAWFKQVQGTDGTADLARLWILQASAKTS
ncbi:MAG TPA: tetratricopeptide repeat protein [Aliidongia sp.]|nr:tetratricopeptide repeat protein [Aliidongia sp.]